MPIKHSVTVIQEKLPHYRASFFEELRARLAAHNIGLRVLYSADCVSPDLPAHLPWATPLKTWRILGLVCQAAIAETSRQDLVIIPQEVKYGALYFLLLKRWLGGQKLAFWGHGRNFQARNPNSLVERWKRFVSSKADWWFAYNSLSAKVVESIGFPSERITIVENAIDTRLLQRTRQELTDSALLRVRKKLGLASENIGIYTGGLYPDKRISFLLDASEKVRAHIPDFELIIIGNGPDRSLAEDAARRFSWVHYVGSKSDMEKIPYWATAKLLLMPGLVGLVVLDSFALCTPVVTTTYPYHSPEIDYLRDGVNGVIVQDWNNPTRYADAVINLLKNEGRRRLLAEQGSKDAEYYSIERMATNFADGIEKALQTPRLKSRGLEHPELVAAT